MLRSQQQLQFMAQHANNHAGVPQAGDQVFCWPHNTTQSKPSKHTTSPGNNTQRFSCLDHHQLPVVTGQPPAAPLSIKSRGRLEFTPTIQHRLYCPSGGIQAVQVASTACHSQVHRSDLLIKGSSE